MLSFCDVCTSLISHQFLQKHVHVHTAQMVHIARQFILLGDHLLRQLWECTISNNVLLQEWNQLFPYIVARTVWTRNQCLLLLHVCTYQADLWLCPGTIIRQPVWYVLDILIPHQEGGDKTASDPMLRAEVGVKICKHHLQ